MANSSTSDGVWSFGLGSYGRLGHGDTSNQMVPTLIRGLKGKNVVGCCSGGDHCIVWTTDNELYAFGRGSSGALGLGDTNNRVVPSLLKGPTNKEVAGVACGMQHTIVWTTDNDVYGFGRSTEGQLGVGDTANRLVPTLIRALSGKNILGVSCGDHHTVAWTDKSVYAFGQTKYGQCGSGETANLLTPTLVAGLNGKNIAGAACGGTHTVVWTEDAETYSFGWGKHGQLGHGDTANQLSATLIQSLKGRQMAGGSCGGSHTVLWTTEGEVCSFGHGGNGRLGTGDNNQKCLAARIPHFKGKTVTGAACGLNHTFIWTSENELYSFGSGSYGQLGGGDTSHRTVPTKVNGLSGKSIAGVSCGGATLVWTSEGGGGGGGNGRKVPTLLKGLDQVAVQQLQNILQPQTTVEDQHPLITSNLSILKETVMDKELNVFVNNTETLAEMLPSTHEDGQQAYLRLQLEKATQRRDSALQRGDVVAVVDEERKIADFRTQLLTIAQEQPKKVGSILSSAEEGVDSVVALEVKVKLQQDQSQDLLVETEHDIEDCTGELAAEHETLAENKSEVERLKKELQEAENEVIRQTDKVASVDRKLHETKAKAAAYQSVIQACENTLNLIMEAHEQRMDLTAQLKAILANVTEYREKEHHEQSAYFISVLPEYEDRALYYVQRAEQARRMIDPRLEKEMHSVSGVMHALVDSCKSALAMLPKELQPPPSAPYSNPQIKAGLSLVAPEPGWTSVVQVPTKETAQDGYDTASPLSTDRGSASPFGRSDAIRRSQVPALRHEVGKRFTKLVKFADTSLTSVVEGLQRFAEAEELPKSSRLLAQFQEKTEDFANSSDGEEFAVCKAAQWLYTTDTWVFDQVNTALMNDTSVALTDLGPYINALCGYLPCFYQFSGVVYKRSKLSDQQLSQYIEGKSFTWPSFVSASTEVDKEDFLGRTLFVITIPPSLALCALNITSLSAFPEEEIALQCYMTMRVIAVHRGGSNKYPNVDDVVELEGVPPKPAVDDYPSSPYCLE